MVYSIFGLKWALHLQRGEWQVQSMSQLGVVFSVGLWLKVPTLFWM